MQAITRNACDRHAEIISSMPLDECLKKYILGCEICAQEEIERLRALVEAAYREGYDDGVTDETGFRFDGKRSTWEESAARAALGEKVTTEG